MPESHCTVERDMLPTIAEPINWTEQLDRHRPWMLKVLRSRVGDAHAADDLLQDVALAVWKQASRPVDENKVPAWLYRLTVRQAINHHRRNGRKSPVTIPHEQLDAAATTQSPLDWLLEREQRQNVQQALAKLSPRDRELLTLKYTEHWTYDQLSQFMGVKVKTIEYRLLKAKRRLRRLVVQGF